MCWVTVFVFTLNSLKYLHQNSNYLFSNRSIFVVVSNGSFVYLAFGTVLSLRGCVREKVYLTLPFCSLSFRVVSVAGYQWSIYVCVWISDYLLVVVFVA